MKETKKHTKHTALIKPVGGKYHRNEWAIIGAPCDLIDQLTSEINKVLADLMTLGYLNAEHKKKRKPNGFNTSHIDKISHQSISLSDPIGMKQHRKYYNHLDGLLINGNHFIGDKQIVIIHEKKKESLSRKLDRLTKVKIIVLMHSSDEIYDFIIDKLEDPGKVQIFRFDQAAKISEAIYKDYQENLPPLNGLILSGGKSQRMGSDKGSIKYHNKEQREYEADLINGYCAQTFISCRKNQDELIESRYSKVYDTFEGLGPYGGILSAFRENPNSAWLTLACDLPYLSVETVKQLVSSRNPRKVATCFYNPETDFPEPLITIWEPRAYPILLEFLSQAYSCPRKVLINSEIEMINMINQIEMKNVNDPKEKSEAEDLLNSNN